MVETPKRSDEDTILENNFKATTLTNETELYIVTLSNRKGEDISSSRNIAMAQFLISDYAGPFNIRNFTGRASLLTKVMFASSCVLR